MTTPTPRAQATAIVVAGFGQNVVLTTVTTFVLAYLIQYAGISSSGIAVVTAIITVAKIADAITDPIMGVIIDLTRTRWGKLRPYILFSAAPVAALTALMFAVPDADEPLQLVYFGVVYVLWGVAYTMCDVPFWGLIGSAFPDAARRTRVIGNVRAFGGISLGLATLGMPWLARALSGGDQATGTGWTLAVALVSVVGMGLYLLAFAVPREREPSERQGRLTLTQLGGTLIRNTPLLFVLLGSVLGFGRFIVQAGGAVFVVVAYGDEGLFTLIGAAIIVGLVASSFATPPLMTRVSGRVLMVVSSVAGAALYLAMYLVGFASIAAIVAFIFLTGLTLGIFLVVQATMIADAVDDAEARTGIRGDGVSFATLTFVSKIMSALAVLVFGLFVTVAGYQADAVVTPEMQHTVFAAITLVPAVSCLLSAVPFALVRRA